jgi:lipopolysaccharide biosynthesis regulator YciM
VPEWLIQVIIQYPIVAIIGAVGWYAGRKVERALKARARRAEELYDRGLAELKAAQERTVEGVKSEVGGLKDELREEFKKLGKKVDELTRRLSP